MIADMLKGMLASLASAFIYYLNSQIIALSFWNFQIGLCLG